MMAADADGNTYIAGEFTGTVDFDPGPSVVNLDSGAPNVQAVFVAKYTADGQLAWAHTGSPRFVGGVSALAIDSDGDVLVYGVFVGIVDFDPGTGQANLGTGGRDIFVWKLDSDGNYIWATSISSPGNSEGSGSLAVDGAGNFVVTGIFNGVTDFDPGFGSYPMTAVGTQDSFVAKYDRNGGLMWAKQFASQGTIGSTSLALDSVGQIYIAGRFRQTADLDPGPTSTNFTADGASDAFLAKLDVYGNLAWAHTWGGPDTSVGETDRATAIVVDGNDDIYVAGQFTGTVDFDPGPGVSQLSALGTTDSFVSKFDDCGHLSWTRQTDGNSYQNITRMSLDRRGNLLLAGTFSGQADFDPGAGFFPLDGAQDFFAAKWDFAGNFVWAGAYSGNINPELPAGIAVDRLGRILTVGWFFGTIDANPGPGGFDLTSAGSFDMFYVQLFDNSVLVAPSDGSTVVSEDGTADMFTVELGCMPAANVTVTLTCGQQLALGSTSLVFTPSTWDVPQTVTVRGINDSVFQKTHYDAVHFVSSSTDANFDAITIPDHSVSILDDDYPPGITVATDCDAPIIVREGGAIASYSVVLDAKPKRDVTITCTTDGQVIAFPSTLVFTPANWKTPQTVQVKAVDDTVVELQMTAIIHHTAASSDSAYAGASSDIGVVVLDNDVPALRLSVASLVMVEGDTRTYTAVLNGAPTSDVTVSIGVSSDLQPANSTLVFGANNWNIPQTIAVTAADEQTVQPNRVDQIIHDTVSADTRFNGVAQTLGVAVIDNDDALVVAGTETTDQISLLFSDPQRKLVQVIVNNKSTFYPTNYNQIIVLAGSGNDTILVRSAIIPVAVLGGTGTDKLTIEGHTTANMFVINEPSVNVNGFNVDLGDVENVVLAGKSASDAFTLSTIPSFALSLQGLGGLDRVTGPDRANTWRITNADTGTLDTTVAFNGIENLSGGSADDWFVFVAGKAVKGTIDGAGGNNALDFSAYKTPVVANLQTSTITGTRGFSNIASLLGGFGSDKLIGLNASSTWNITGANTGTVGTLAFQCFENLVGGSGDDHFVFAEGASMKGKIDGGGGTDELDYGSFLAALKINLQAKTATNTGGWLNVEQFVGGAGVNSFTGANKVSTWHLTGAGSGDVGGITFQNFYDLTGGALADLFDFSSGGTWLGLLDGGAGVDTLQSAGPYMVTGVNAGTAGGRQFKGIEKRL